MKYAEAGEAYDQKTVTGRTAERLQSAEDILAEQGLVKAVHESGLERALGAELMQHLGYEKHDPAGYGRGNARNGSSEKTLTGKNGEIHMRSRGIAPGASSRRLYKRHQTRFDGFDDKVLSMNARGMTTREIQGRL